MASVGTNMVFVLPSEFYAPDRKDWPVAQLDFGPQPVIFENPREKNYKHLNVMYLKGYINNHPINKMLVDTGAAVNIMPYLVQRRLGCSVEDLIKTNITLSDFNGQASEAQGVLNVDLTMGSKTVPTPFFIVVTPQFREMKPKHPYVCLGCSNHTYSEQYDKQMKCFN
jgi:hypothetical protein